MKEINEKYSKQIYLNILKAIIFIAYFLTLNLAYEVVKPEHMEIGSKILTMVFLFIGIYIIERAYKKDDGTLAIQGIEILILATYTLTTEHIINKFDFNFKSYSLVASYLYAAYFLLRSIFIYTKARKEVAEELSDIREIVKKEEPAKKEAVKKSENKDEKVDAKKTTTAKATTIAKKTSTNKTASSKKTTTGTKKETTNKTTSSKKATTGTKKETTNKTTAKKTTTTKKAEPKKKKEEVKEND